MITYFLTIAKHQVKDYVDKDDLIQVCHELKLRHPNLELHNIVYETSTKYRQLHLHCIAYNDKKIWYKDNCSLNGYSIKWKPIFNLARACRYMQKQVKNKYEQEQLLTENYYQHHYGFQN